MGAVDNLAASLFSAVKTSNDYDVKSNGCICMRDVVLYNVINN